MTPASNIDHSRPSTAKIVGAAAGLLSGIAGAAFSWCVCRALHGDYAIAITVSFILSHAAMGYRK